MPELHNTIKRNEKYNIQITFAGMLTDLTKRSHQMNRYK